MHQPGPSVPLFSPCLFNFDQFLLDRGNALVLDSMDRLVLYSLRKGCTFYDFRTIAPFSLDAACEGSRNDGSPYCNQGIALLKNATYVASVSKRGVIHILRTRDGSQAGWLNIPGISFE